MINSKQKCFAGLFCWFENAQSSAGFSAASLFFSRRRGWLTRLQSAAETAAIGTGLKNRLEGVSRQKKQSKFPSVRTSRLVIQLGFLFWWDSSFVILKIQVNKSLFAKFTNPSFITCLTCYILTTSFAKTYPGEWDCDAHLLTFEDIVFSDSITASLTTSLESAQSPAEWRVCRLISTSGSMFRRKSKSATSDDVQDQARSARRGRCYSDDDNYFGTLKLTDSARSESPTLRETKAQRWVCLWSSES